MSYRSDKLFLVLPLLLSINLMFHWNSQSFITEDSRVYFSIADNLPSISESTFPILYPLVLRIVNTFFSDYNLAYKIVNIICIAFTFGFLYAKKFFWKPVWTLLCFASFLEIYYHAWSENLVIPLLMVFFYLNHKFLTNTNNSFSRYITINTIVFVLLFLTKYNSAFFIAGIIPFVLLFRSQIGKKSKFLLISATAAIILCVFYLLLNKYNTGYMVGSRTDVIQMSFLRYVVLSLANIPITIDPYSFALLKILYIKTHFYLWTVPYVIAFFGMIIFFWWIIKKVLLNNFNKFCFILCTVFVLLSMISAYFTRVDILGPRLLLGFHLPIWLGFFAGSRDYINNIKNSLWIIIGTLSILLHSVSMIINGFG